MKSSTLSLVNDQANEEEIEPITDLSLEERVIALLEEARILRHQLTNKRSAYEMAMQINHRLQMKNKELNARLQLLELANQTFNTKKSA